METFNEKKDNQADSNDGSKKEQWLWRVDLYALKYLQPQVRAQIQNAGNTACLSMVTKHKV